MISRKIKNVIDKEKIVGVLDQYDYNTRLTKRQQEKIKKEEKYSIYKKSYPNLKKPYEPIQINRKKAKSLASNTNHFKKEKIDYLSKVHFIASEKLELFKDDDKRALEAVDYMLKSYDKILPSFCKISPEVNLEALEYVVSVIKLCKNKEYMSKDAYKNVILNLVLGIRTFIEEFTNEQLAKVINALGHLGPEIVEFKEKKVSVHETFITLYKEIVKREDYTSEELSLIMEGIGNLNYKHKKLEEVIKHISNICNKYYEDVKVYNAKPFLPRIAARLIKGFGLVKYNGCMSFCKEVITDMTCNMKYYILEDIADIIWGFANITYMPNNELTMIEEYFNDNYEDFEPNDFARLIWGFSEISYYPSDTYFELSSNYIIKNKDKFTSEDITYITKAFGNYGMLPSNNTEISNIIKKYHERYLGNFKIDDSIAVLVSLAQSNVLDFETLDTAIRRLYTDDTCNIMTLDNKSDIYKCILDVEAFSNNEKKEYTGSFLMLDEAKDAWKVDQLTKANHDHAIPILKNIEYWDLKIEPKNKLEIGKSFLKCDSAFHPKFKIPIAVLICDVSDYFHNIKKDNEKFKGRVAWKIKMLKRYGFSVLTIDFEKWINLKRESRKEYIKGKLDEVVKDGKGRRHEGRFLKVDFGYKFKYWEMKPLKPKNKDPFRRKRNYKPNVDPTKNVFRDINKGLE